MSEVCDSYLNCDIKNLTWEQLAKMTIAMSSDGCPAVRVITNVGEPIAFREMRASDGFELRASDGFELNNSV